MTPWPTRPFLALAGLLLVAIGGSILVVPHAFFATNGIVLGDDPSLLSEIRAPGGLLAASGLLILLGAVRAGVRPLATTLTVLVYGSFGLARLVAMAFDGLPASGVVGATVIELVIAAIGLVVLVRRSGSASAVPSASLTETASA
ncbi:MAG: DUF4345 domain-containing protein [Acidobacteriota bacterium]